MSSIFRLHPQLRHAIVHELGWRTLRPVQEQAIDAILDGANTVILAPTAGGKTEASMFPVLSRVLSEDIGPVAALYVSPIRALLNNQEERLRQYARMVGLSVFKWHGDVPAASKKRFRSEPAHILMITPESLEVMLMGRRAESANLFRDLAAIVIDEVHAFAADDRGAHLASLLERLTALGGRDIQRIGLSATVGNPHEILGWLEGSSRRPRRLVDPRRPPRPTGGAPERDVRIELHEDLEPAAARIAELARGKKSLVFSETRSQAEKVGRALQGRGVEVFVHHSSVSRADRESAERQFAEGHNTAIVCTATMELGIDVGDLDQVLQIDAPRTVASFLQRIGRTGRREGRRANCTFFCQSPESLLQALAIARLAESGWVEDVAPSARALHVLAHQVMALAIQEGGVSRHRIGQWIEDAFPFVGIPEAHVEELIATMLERDILFETGGLLSLGTRGEQLYGRKNFFELYAVFSSPPIMKVMHGRTEVGHVQATFVQSQVDAEAEDQTMCFRLAGRSWQVLHTDWGRAVLSVEPAEAGRVPSWLGPPMMKSFELCQAMADVLRRGDPDREARWLTPSAERELTALRNDYAPLFSEGSRAPLECGPDGVQWHTFAGGAINRLLAAGLEAMTGRRWIAGDLTVRARNADQVEARTALAGLLDRDWEAIAQEAAGKMPRGRLTKFQPCLSAEMENRLLVSKLLDVEGTLRFLGTVTVGTRDLKLGQRLDDAAIALEQPNAELLVPKGRPARYVLRHVPIWIDDDEALASAVARVRQARVVGLDVETTSQQATLCLVQLAITDATFVIDVPAIARLDKLVAVLQDPEVTKIIHHASFERRVFKSLSVTLAGVFDTLEASRRRHGPDALGGHSLAAVCERELGVSLDKTEQTSNWARRPLSAAQLEYAAADAEVLLPLYERLGRP